MNFFDDHNMTFYLMTELETTSVKELGRLIKTV